MRPPDLHVVREDDEELIEALRQSIERARGSIKLCPDCSGSGRDAEAFGYCQRCDGRGEIRVRA
jgi:DnaJ-class molecular chaperone